MYHLACHVCASCDTPLIAPGENCLGLSNPFRISMLSNPNVTSGRCKIKLFSRRILPHIDAELSHQGGFFLLLIC